MAAVLRRSRPVDQTKGDLEMPQQDDENGTGTYPPGTPADDHSGPQADAANPTQPIAGSPASAPVPGEALPSDTPQLPGAHQYGGQPPLNATGEPAESGTWGAPAGVAQTTDGTHKPTATWKKVAGGVALAAVVAVGGVAAVNAANASNASSGQAGPGAMTSGAGGYGQGFGPGDGGDTGRQGGID